jgi:DNA topoisomerase-3
VRKTGPKGRVVFTLTRQLCQKEVPLDEVRRLLDAGKTELIDGFISKRGLPFKAYLIVAKNKARAEFEFPPR